MKMLVSAKPALGTPSGVIPNFKAPFHDPHPMCSDCLSSLFPQPAALTLDISVLVLKSPGLWPQGMLSVNFLNTGTKEYRNDCYWVNLLTLPTF